MQSEISICRRCHTDFCQRCADDPTGAYCDPCFYEQPEDKEDNVEAPDTSGLIRGDLNYE